MIYKTTKQLDFFQHTDGRSWLRLDGEVIAEAHNGMDVPFVARAHYRKFGAKIVDAVVTIQEAMANAIAVSHPQFSRPYEY